jgi:hypothetical protein
MSHIDFLAPIAGYCILLMESERHLPDYGHDQINVLHGL